MVMAAASGAGSDLRLRSKCEQVIHHSNNQLNQMAATRLTSLAIMQTRRFSQRSASERSESPLTELESEDQQQQPQSSPRKSRRKTKAVEPVVYDIPPVESKTTTYRGLVS